jgi:hypothetical protein
METEIVENVLSDGSKTYDVVIVEGSSRVVIACTNQEAAEMLQSAFLGCAEYATIEDMVQA